MKRLEITMIYVTDRNPEDPDENVIGMRRAISAKMLEQHGQFIVSQEAQEMYRQIMEKYEETR